MIRNSLLATGALAVVALAVLLNFVGYIESDDMFYFQGAVGWITHSPFLGLDHWSIRHMIILPMVFGFKLFGESEATLILPSICYALLFLFLVGAVTRHLGGMRAAWLAVVLAGVTPAVATGATFVTTDMPEAFFILCSMWLWHRGREIKSPLFMAISGMAAGCGLITRETTIALLVFYFLVFIIEKGHWFRGWLWLTAGLVLVIGSDWLYLYSMSGDPLYRIHIALKGASGDGPQLELTDNSDSGVDRFGAVRTPLLLRPFGAVFVNQNFGLLFWAAVPVSIFLASGSSSEVKRASFAMIIFCLVWFLTCGYILSKWLWIIPRYYLVGTVLVIPLALWLSKLFLRHKVWATILCSILIFSSLTLDLGSTVGVMAGERGLVAVVEQFPGIIYTDPSTARGSHWLLERLALADRVSIDKPGPNSLYYFDSRPRRPIPVSWPYLQIPHNWTMVEQRTFQSKWTGQIVRLLGISNLLPAGLRAKLDPPPLTTALYRLPS